MLNCIKRTRQLITVEMAIERDFITDLVLTVVDPSIGHMRKYFPLEICLYVFLEGNVLRVTKITVRLRLSFSVKTYSSSLIPFTQGFYYRLQFGGRKTDT